VGFRGGSGRSTSPKGETLGKERRPIQALNLEAAKLAACYTRSGANWPSLLRQLHLLGKYMIQGKPLKAPTGKAKEFFKGLANYYTQLRNQLTPASSSD
jgi:hypothetical protein